MNNTKNRKTICNNVKVSYGSPSVSKMSFGKCIFQFTSYKFYKATHYLQILKVYFDK